MQSRGSGHRAPGPLLRSRISTVMLSMFATMASFYVAGRLWQDAQSRVYLIKELDRRTGQGLSAISVDDTLKVVACRHQHKKLVALEMELASAKHEGFVGKYSSEPNGTQTEKRLLAVIGIMTGFGRKSYRDAIRKSWLPSGATLKKLEEEKGILVRFIIGRSANRGDSFDREIDEENKYTKDFIILDNHIEASEEHPKKTKLFFAHAAETIDAEFYAKVNDDLYVNTEHLHNFNMWESNHLPPDLIPLVGSLALTIIPKAQAVLKGTINSLKVNIHFTMRQNADSLGAMLATHWDKPRVYIGCMKSGEVFSESSHKWYEPDWWKFGDGKSYFRHASGEMLVISRALAQFISINRSVLRTYAHDDVSVGSWMIGLDVKHVNEGKLCCSPWSSGAICAAL